MASIKMQSLTIICKIVDLYVSKVIKQYSKCNEFEMQH